MECYHVQIKKKGFDSYDGSATYSTGIDPKPKATSEETITLFGNWSQKANEPVQQVQSHGEEVLPTSAESLPEEETLAASQGVPECLLDPPALLNTFVG